MLQFASLVAGVRMAQGMGAVLRHGPNRGAKAGKRNRPRPERDGYRASMPKRHEQAQLMVSQAQNQPNLARLRGDKPDGSPAGEQARGDSKYGSSIGPEYCTWLS